MGKSFDKVLMGAAGTDGTYEIEQSLIYDHVGSGALVRTPSSASNRKTWTWSGWVKRSETSLVSNQHFFLFSADGNSDHSYMIFYADKLLIEDYDASVSRKWFLNTNRLFRDFGAWYHIVLAADTTQGTASNRLKLYVNGVQETSFATATYPAQNYDGFVNTTLEHTVGNGFTNAANYTLGGYLAEVHFIDGTALTPSSFGKANSDTGQWIPKKYTGGSYGTNGFYLPFKIGGLYSADFDGTGDYLSQTSMTTIGSGDFTIEGWCNRRDDGAQGIFQYSNGALNSKSGALGLGIYDNDFYLYYGTSGALAGRAVTANIPAVGEWWHFAYVRASGTITIYLNGTAVTTQSTTVDFNDTTLVVGGYYNTDFLWNGLISNFRAVKGTAVYTSNFTPPTSALTSVSGTILLNCQNSNIQTSTTGSNMTAQGNAVASNTSPTDFNDTFSGDRSGQGNSYTATNLANSDVVIDSPTNNFATWNPLQSSTNSQYLLTQGNLFPTFSSSPSSFMNSSTTIGATSGKWYAELRVVVATSNGCAVGGGSYITKIDTSNQNVLNAALVVLSITHNQSAYRAIWVDGTATTTGLANGVVGDIYGLAMDVDNNKFYYYRNGSALGSTSGYTLTDVGTGVFTFQSQTDSATNMWNFGQDSSFNGAITAGTATDGNGIGVFKYAPPSGFLALCTANLPDPAIPLPSANFNTVLYAGNASTQSISGVGFEPSFVWAKNRSRAGGHGLFDAVRGAGKSLESSDTTAERTQSDSITSFNSDGFSLGDNTEAGPDVNYVNNDSYVSWNWKANGSGSNDTSGDIDATVSANQAAGFSVVKWASDGNTATVGHGLGAVPTLIIAKNRSEASAWSVYSAEIGNTKRLVLNTTAASATDAVWGNTTPTSSLFTQRISITSGHEIIAYCFAPKPGYSKIGTYTGNGSATAGTFVNCGFKPAWLMYKKTSGAAEWRVYDSGRSVFNPVKLGVYPDLTNAEDSGFDFDFLSNGFKSRANHADVNESGGTYLYMAFAESPFKTANAR